MADSRFTIREDVKEDGSSEQHLIAFYGSVLPADEEYSRYDPMLRCIYAKHYGRNPDVEHGQIFADYYARFSRPISEAAARALHPKMFTYLDPCSDFSRLNFAHRQHDPAVRRLSFDVPVLYCELPRLHVETTTQYSSLLGTAAVIEQIKQQFDADPLFDVLDDVLPAVPRDFHSARVFGGFAFDDEDAVRAYLRNEKTA